MTGSNVQYEAATLITQQAETIRQQAGRIEELKDKLADRVVLHRESLTNQEKLEQQLTTLKAEIERLRKDQQRLEWCWKHHYLDAVKDWVAMPELDMRQTLDKAFAHDIAATQPTPKTDGGGE